MDNKELRTLLKKISKLARSNKIKWTSSSENPFDIWESRGVLKGKKDDLEIEIKYTWIGSFSLVTKVFHEVKINSGSQTVSLEYDFIRDTGIEPLVEDIYDIGTDIIVAEWKREKNERAREKIEQEKSVYQDISGRLPV